MSFHSLTYPAIDFCAKDPERVPWLRCSWLMQVLTLANGDRVLMTPQMKAFFEPENLNNASPATVSRAGIIYVSDTELGWQPVVSSWLQVSPHTVAGRRFSMLPSLWSALQLGLVPGKLWQGIL